MGLPGKSWDKNFSKNSYSCWLILFLASIKCKEGTNATICKKSTKVAEIQTLATKPLKFFHRPQELKFLDLDWNLRSEKSE